MTTHDFAVSLVDAFRNVGKTYRGSVTGHLAGVSVGETAVPENEPVQFDYELTAAPGGITLKGLVTAPWRAECRRCLGEVTGQLVGKVNEVVTKSEDDEPLPEVIAEGYQYSGDEYDLEPIVRDTVVLALPLAPLCSDDCRGLCPVCGANRNETLCGCELEVRDPRWDLLDELKSEELGE